MVTTTKNLLRKKDWERHSEICSYWHDIILTLFLTTTTILLTVTLIRLLHFAKRKRYKLSTWYYKLKLAHNSNEWKRKLDFDVYLSYVHDDDQIMEEMRTFLEDVHNIKCCIPQRNFGVCDTDDVTALEQSLEKSALTVVLWSRAALASKWHKAEVKLARYVELYRHFDFRIIHIFLQDLSNVSDDFFKLLLKNGDYMQWTRQLSDKQKTEFLDQLLVKVYRRLQA